MQKEKSLEVPLTFLLLLPHKFGESGLVLAPPVLLGFQPLEEPADCRLLSLTLGIAGNSGGGGGGRPVLLRA